MEVTAAAAAAASVAVAAALAKHTEMPVMAWAWVERQHRPFLATKMAVGRGRTMRVDED